MGEALAQAAAIQQLGDHGYPPYMLSVSAEEGHGFRFGVHRILAVYGPSSLL